MDRKLRIFLPILFICTISLFSCQREFEEAHEEVESSLIADAKRFVQAEIAFGTRSKEETSMGDFTPLWDGAKISTITHTHSVDIPIVSEYEYRATIQDSVDGQNHLVPITEKIVVTKSLLTGDMGLYRMMVVPDFDYYKSNSGDLSGKFTCSGDKHGFSGVIFYTYMNGSPFIAITYKNGKGVSGINLPHSDKKVFMREALKLHKLISGLNIQRRTTVATRTDSDNGFWWQYSYYIHITGPIYLDVIYHELVVDLDGDGYPDSFWINDITVVIKIVNGELNLSDPDFPPLPTPNQGGDSGGSGGSDDSGGGGSWYPPNDPAWPNQPAVLDPESCPFKIDFVDGRPEKIGVSYRIAITKPSNSEYDVVRLLSATLTVCKNGAFGPDYTFAVGIVKEFGQLIDFTHGMPGTWDITAKIKFNAGSNDEIELTVHNSFDIQLPDKDEILNDSKVKAMMEDAWAKTKKGATATHWREYGCVIYWNTSVDGTFYDFALIKGDSSSYDFRATIPFKYDNDQTNRYNNWGPGRFYVADFHTHPPLSNAVYSDPDSHYSRPVGPSKPYDDDSRHDTPGPNGIPSFVYDYIGDDKGNHTSNSSIDAPTRIYHHGGTRRELPF